MGKMEEISDMQVHPIILLTGAGFTHNFGGYLATQMWEHIFNFVGISGLTSLQSRMKDKNYYFNYEKIYAALQERAGRESREYQVYLAALEKVYQDLDELVVRSLDQKTHEVSLVGLRRWLARWFSASGNLPKNKGFVFSLNQDLFFERHARDEFSVWIPGAPLEAQAPNVQKSNAVKRIRLAADMDASAIRGNLKDLNLIKLHGSCNWDSSKGAGLMVLGEGKADAINNEPLLNYYLKLFNDVLSRPNLQLWVIGYGFGDSHINACIARSIKQFGLKLCVIDYCRPNDFFERLKKAPKGSDIKDGVSAFVANSLVGVFPKQNCVDSKPLAEIEKIMETVSSVNG